MKLLRRVSARLRAMIMRQSDEQRLREEFDAHLALAVDDYVRQGMTPEEARRKAVLKFGAVESVKEAYRDQRLLPRLEVLKSDVVFGWRQLNKHRVASAAAILSLALAAGATTAAFRLVDAVLLRSLPIAEPERLFSLARTFVDRDGRHDYRDEFTYPAFREYRDAVKDDADAMVVGITNRRAKITYLGDPEKVSRQFLSGNVFGIFGLNPAVGRLFSTEDDMTPGGHPVAVLSYDYWTRRFSRDPGVLGKTFRDGNVQYQIIGVGPKGFVGTEPGTVADIFVPAMMNTEAIEHAGWSWMRIWVRPRHGVSAEQVQQRLQAVLTNQQRERIKNFSSDTPRQVIDAALNERILVSPAGAGTSELQKSYKQPLYVLGLMVALVLLIACANVANLLAAQATARAREMALRVSIGAGRARLVQLVLVECAMIAVAATVLGAAFASWAAPMVTSLLRVPQDPVRIVFETGWRELVFGAALALLVTMLFGLAPALRASGVQPVNALKGTDERQSRKRLMNALVAAQAAFCVLVLFVAGLFIGTFQRLANRPLGFSAERVVTMFTSASSEAQPIGAWLQVAEQVEALPGVESVSLSGWPLVSGDRWTNAVKLPGREIDARAPYFLEISQGFMDTMRMERLDGRDFRASDRQPRLDQRGQALAGVGIVNEAFAKRYFNGANPIGRSVEMRVGKDVSAPLEIIGYVRDAAYFNLREPIAPTVYVPMREQRGNITFIIRTAGDPSAMIPTLRREISRVRSDFRVGDTVSTQSDIIRWHLLRERMLATLSLFFAVVALVLAAVGLYGVLNYTVTRQRREIGIRMALGARWSHVVRNVTAGVVVTIAIGSAIGLAGGLAVGRVVESLLWDVKSTDAEMIALPVVALMLVAVLAALPTAMRATRIDPARTLRSE